MNEQELSEIETWLVWNFRPCSDAFPRVEALIREVRALRGWSDPHISIPTLDAFTADIERRETTPA
jgi:hypothetical protein